MTVTDLHSLSGAYALHALSDDERAAFAHHLTGCEACGQEIAEFTATAARLALAATAPVHPAMRDQVLGRITTVRQVHPDATRPEQARRLMPRWRGPARWALAASVAAAVAFGGTAVWQYERAQDAHRQVVRAQRHADELARVLAAPDARSRSAKVAGGAGTLVVSAGRDQAVFVASRMPAPPHGRVYQLWFADGGKMRSAGLMNPGRSSQAVLMDGAVGRASGVGITVEPAGGSAQPTSAPLALLRMPA
ncbi:anti-sigma factor domain-containing protein [Streptomyces sp. NPDC014846]|uniref:anti-sigma factor n=1 Tax=Streptomyces sp. NPDC014846 TaxID=3364922 RepID=UPI0036FF6CD0